MKLTITQLRRIIKEEAEEQVKTGKEQADTKGTLDVKMIATTLGVDPGAFATAVKAAKAGNRSAGHNAILGDVFVKLMEASPEDTVKVMNVLKKVTEAEPSKEVAESRRRAKNKKNLLESYSRITEKEMAEWKKGNWGYVSEAGDANSEDMPEDYEQCGVCNYDHDYDFPTLSREEMEVAKQLHADAGFEISPPYRTLRTHYREGAHPRRNGVSRSVHHTGHYADRLNRTLTDCVKNTKIK